MWKYYAILSAVFAALTAIFAKIGVKNIDSNLATAIRTCVILLITWGIVFVGNSLNGIKGLTKMNWIFLILSGAATGLSWLFYFKALQQGEASKVAPIDKLSVVFTIFLSFIILKETVSWKVILGACLIAAGSLVILMDKQ
ncbi:membrane protein [Bacteroidia bacterium]|nr:membrane protein [Bacteroidia bacterium]